MKKRYTLLSKASLICVIVLFTLFNCQKERNATSALMDSRIVPEYFARQVAEKFDGEQFFKNSRDTLIQQNTPESGLVVPPRIREIKNSYTFYDKNKKPAIYLFNYAQGGFVFVSAEYTLQPILAYVPSGGAKRDTVPGGFLMWLQKTIQNVEIVRDGLYDNSRIGVAAWTDFLEINKIVIPYATEQVFRSFSRSKSLAGGQNINAPIEPEPDCEHWYNTTVGPLLTVNWGQGKSYNNLINPNVNYGCFQTGNDRPWTGCVATAMAQVIRYWKCSPFYDYNSMPNSSGNVEVQKLMHNIGIYIDMDWGCESSSVNSGKIDNTLKAYFGINSIDRIWNDFNIYNTTLTNLKKGWPVLLGGCEDRHDYLFFHIPYNCHEWVCDGYKESASICYGTYLYFHLNWGWHETNGSPDYNGWFGTYNWNLPIGPDNFQYYNDAFVNIHP